MPRQLIILPVPLYFFGLPLWSQRDKKAKEQIRTNPESLKCETKAVSEKSHTSLLVFSSVFVVAKTVT
jgi:hypothetical protein